MNPHHDPAPTGIIDGAVKAAVEELETAPVPYQGVKYERSDVTYVHLPLQRYLEKRGLALSEQLQALVKYMPAGTYIAGGSVAAQVSGSSISAASDIDLFFHDRETFEEAVAMLRFASKEVTGAHVPEGVVMFEPPAGRGLLPIQAINIAWFDGVEDVLDGFDFTVTHFGIDVGTQELVFNPESPADYARRQLVHHRVEGDDALRKRIAKYIAKGFKPVGETLGHATRLGLWSPEKAVDQAVVGRAEHCMHIPV